MKAIIYQLVAIGVLSVVITFHLIQIATIDDKHRFVPMLSQKFIQTLDNVSVRRKPDASLLNINNPVPILSIPTTTHRPISSPFLSKNENSNVNDEKTILNYAKNFTSSDDYCFFYHFTEAEGLKNVSQLYYEPISLALHSTINYARMIPRQADTWEDFVSFAIFMHPGSEIYLKDLKKLHYCHKRTRLKVSIHLVYAKGFMQMECPTALPIEIASPKNCKNISVISIMRKLTQIRPPLFAYPINVMRNAARKGARTKLHIVADSENIFSKKFAQKVRNVTSKMFNEWNDTLLVFRRFEVDETIQPLPLDLKGLKKALKERKANFFHALVYGRGHMIPNMVGWMNYSLSNSTIIAESIKYKCVEFLK